MDVIAHFTSGELPGTLAIWASGVGVGFALALAIRRVRG